LERTFCFEADTIRRKEALARKFYGSCHADDFLSLSDDKIASNISFYAEAAVRQAWTEFSDDQPAQRRFMKSLVTKEYVLVEPCSLAWDLEKGDEWDGGSVASYPHPVMYDDWYERSLGADVPYEGYIMKSTGESFSKRELQWLDASVKLVKVETILACARKFRRSVLVRGRDPERVVVSRSARTLQSA
jgi:hypothetical protein